MRYAQNHCDQAEQGGKIRFSGPCWKCGELQYVDVSKDSIVAYEQGLKIQHAAPDLSRDECEFLMSGICATCWERILG